MIKLFNYCFYSSFSRSFWKSACCPYIVKLSVKWFGTQFGYDNQVQKLWFETVFKITLVKNQKKWQLAGTRYAKTERWNRRLPLTFCGIDRFSPKTIYFQSHFSKVNTTLALKLYSSFLVLKAEILSFLKVYCLHHLQNCTIWKHKNRMLVFFSIPTLLLLLGLSYFHHNQICASFNIRNRLFQLCLKLRFFQN